MSNFWPSGLDMKDTASPEIILSTASDEWSDKSGGVITLAIQDTKSTSGDRLLIVHAKHVPSKRTVTLFSVLHRPNAPYPARIYPAKDAVPDHLKKTYYQPGFSLAELAIGGASGHDVTNDWVCDTPSEFRSHLSEVFNQGVVKSEVLGLIAGATPPPQAPTDATPPPEAPPDAASGSG
jgi:hypothetical protein